MYTPGVCPPDAAPAARGITAIASMTSSSAAAPSGVNLRAKSPQRRPKRSGPHRRALRASEPSPAPAAHNADRDFIPSLTSKRTLATWHGVVQACARSECSPVYRTAVEHMASKHSQRPGSTLYEDAPLRQSAHSSRSLVCSTALRKAVHSPVVSSDQHYSEIYTADEQGSTAYLVCLPAPPCSCRR